MSYIGVRAGTLSQNSFAVEWYGGGSATDSPAEANGIVFNGTTYNGTSGNLPNGASYTTGRFGFAITASFFGLTANTSYTINIRSNVGSTLSPSLSVTTASPSLALSVASSTSTSINLAVTPSSGSISGSNYTLTYGASTLTGTYNGSSIAVTGLSVGTSYSFTIAISGFTSDTKTFSTLSVLSATTSTINATSAIFALTKTGSVALPTSGSSYTVVANGLTVSNANKAYSGGNLTVNGLTADLSYNVTITASGFTTASPATFRTLKAFTATLRSAATTSTSVVYDISSASSLPAGFTVTSGGAAVTSSLSGSVLTLSGLSAATAYTFVIAAAGFQSVTTASVTTKGSFTVAATPVSAGATSLVLGLTPVGATSLPASSASWTITYLPSGTVASADISFNTSSNQLTIRGLTEYTSYTFTITPSGSTSVTVTAMTKDVTAPGSIAGLVAAAGDKKVDLSWNDLSDSGSAISYVIKDLSSNTEVTVSTPYTTISSLTNGVSYQYSVRAIDADGNEGAPTNTSILTPYSTPYAPTAVTAVAGAYSAAVSWTDGENGGATVTSYRVRAYRAADLTTVVGDVSGASAPLTVTGLAAYERYVFTVTASNVYGPGATSAASAETVVLDRVVCLLADAPVRTPTGERAIGSLRVGDLVETADGRAVPIHAIKIMMCVPGAESNPFIIPRGRWGATEDLPISPNHRVRVEGGRMVEAKALGLKQRKMTGTITYYNLELPNWESDNMVVAGVVVESMAPVRRKAIPLAEFNAMIARKYGKNPSAAVVDKLRRMCTFLPNGMVEYPFLKKSA